MTGKKTSKKASRPATKAAGARSASQDASELTIWPRYGNYYPLDSRMDLDFALSHQMVRTAQTWRNLVDVSLRMQTGQSRARWEMLFAIAFSEVPVTMSEVAEKLGVQWPTLVRVMNELEEEGLIQRYDNPADKRSRLIKLTDRGTRTIEQIRATLDPLRKQIMSVLSSEEIRQCTRLLGRVKRAIMSYDATLLSQED